jgi:predicted nucleotidyltransferase
LSLLIKSKLREKLLVYSFTHQTESFYVRQIAVLIDADPGNLSRELRKLAEEGVFNSSIKGKEKFYILNKAYPLYKQLKEIISKSAGIESTLKELVSGYNGIVLAFIYGSFVQGREDRTSDIDLLIVGTIPRDDFTRKIRQLESKLNREINFTVFTEDEFAQKRKSKGSFLDVMLKGKVIMLRGRDTVI